MAQAKRIACCLAALVGPAILVFSQAAPTLAQSPSTTATTAAPLNYRLIFILVGSLILATAILAGVIIFMLKKFKDKY